ncbi:uncharacterized protein LOC120637588 isoform X2 [Pararge aegeria]|uniref:Jg13059 protein n=1 Tax=Pararge aegeria aegeria TaxID=348720 RepID=A0A8S4S9C4_9NEOP|nr:uncharacterized protein LOC120637588 isoform X2 [Pararge aegeria]CAH2257667.1 jg13059 [Pararge aegeria aegeria]
MTYNLSSSRNVSYAQVKKLIDFMGLHVEFAIGNLRTLEARHTSKTLWCDLTRVLNNSIGTKKTTDGWSKYWSDFKAKLKKKVNALKKTKTAGSLSDTPIKPLSRLEKRALIILGPQFERKIVKDPVEPFNNNYGAEVKLEGYNGNSHNSFACNLSESSDRQSDESNDNEDSNEEFDDNLSEENEPVLHGIYPKWLIEIEKKRVDADLARARAEEQRANTAAKNSEAAQVQAEALKKLADAAVIQADALTKIADILDNNALRQIVPF